MGRVCDAECPVLSRPGGLYRQDVIIYACEKKDNDLTIEMQLLSFSSNQTKTMRKRTLSGDQMP